MTHVIDLVGFNHYSDSKLLDIIEAAEKELEKRNKEREHCNLCNSVLD